MTKLAHYFYPCGHEIVINNEGGRMTVRDGRGNLPVCPVRNMPFLHPDEDEGRKDGMLSYGEVGMYYGYSLVLV